MSSLHESQNRAWEGTVVEACLGPTNVLCQVSDFDVLSVLLDYENVLVHYQLAVS